MLKYIIIISLLALFSCSEASDYRQDIDKLRSQVVFNLAPIGTMVGEIDSRGVNDVTSGTLQGRLNNLYACLMNESGSIIDYKSIANSELADLKQLSYNLELGKYTLSLLGEGKNTAFSDSRPELKDITDANSPWLSSIHIFPVRSEWFFATDNTITVDGSSDKIVYELELKRAVGRVDLQLRHNANTSIIGFSVGFDKDVIPTSITPMGKYLFTDSPKDDGTGNYSVYNKETGPNSVSFFSFPTVGTASSGRVSVTYKEQGVVMSKTIPIKNYRIEANKVTKLDVTLNTL